MKILSEDCNVKDYRMSHGENVHNGDHHFDILPHTSILISY